MRYDITGANAGVALEHDEAPWRAVAVIRHARADGENGFELSGRGAGARHVARFHRTADFQEFEGVRHYGLFLQVSFRNCYHADS